MVEVHCLRLCLCVVKIAKQNLGDFIINVFCPLTDLFARGISVKRLMLYL